MRPFSAVVLLAAAIALSGCGDARFVGFDNCSSDGSVVWFERSNSQGSYAGLDNDTGKCRPRS